jgi:outer membrane protein assembly factor BamB
MFGESPVAWAIDICPGASRPMNGSVMASVTRSTLRVAILVSGLVLISALLPAGVQAASAPSLAPSQSTGPPGRAISSSLLIPATAQPGIHTLKAAGTSSGRSATAPFTVQTNWFQYGRDNQHTFYNPYENVLNAHNVGSITKQWVGRVELDSVEGQGITSPPAVVGPYAYVTSNLNYLAAFDRYTGELAWPKNPSGFCGQTSSPAVDVGRVVWTFSSCSQTSGGGQRMQDALDPTVAVPGLPGQQGWTGQPVTVNGVAYYAETGFAVYNDVPRLFAADMQTGALLWSRKVDSLDVVVDKGRVFTERSGHVFGLDAQTGAIMWSRSGLTGVTLASDGVLYGADPQGLVAINENTGATLWNKPGYSVVAAGGGVLYGGGSGGFAALNASDGSVRWETAIPGQGFTVADGVIYVTSDAPHTLSMYRASDGSFIASRSLSCCPRAHLTTPVVADGYVYLGLKRRLIAYSLP